MQRLMILRHAKAVPWYPAVDDFNRMLSDAGREHAEKIASWLSAHLELPQEILCSPALRTRQTLAPLLSLRPELDALTRFAPQMYGASTQTLNGLLDAAFSELDRVLLVGHNPTLEMLAFAVLSRSQCQKLNRLTTGTLLVVDFEDGWPEGAGDGILSNRIRGKKL
jgi:phosphohistidine phosphatase